MKIIKNLSRIIINNLVRIFLIPLFPLFFILFSFKSRYRLSIINFSKSYMFLIKNPKYIKINLKIFIWIVKSWKRKELDYGRGFLYQSYENIGLYGLRATNKKINLIENFINLKNKKILDIGSNSSFLSVEIAKKANFVDCVEPNKYLIKQGQIVADFFKLLNMNFYETKFEQFYTNNKYSTVLSCANHSTYDGETEYSLDEYFSKISNLLIERGSLLFESHHPLIEKDISDVKNCISKYFDIKEEIIVEGGNFIDNGRTWLLCKKLIVK